MAKGGIATKLDWNRMLGFEQVPEARQAIRDESAAPLGAKVGEKLGDKVGLKTGTKIGLKQGVKTR
jgi:hypothetical protein